MEKNFNVCGSFLLDCVEFLELLLACYEREILQKRRKLLLSPEALWTSSPNQMVAACDDIFLVGVAETQGRRAAMEDEMVVSESGIVSRRRRFFFLFFFLSDFTKSSLPFLTAMEDEILLWYVRS